MGEQVTIQIRIDSDLREEAAKVFDELGLDLSSGIRMYLKAVAREQGIPFNTYLKSETSRKPSRMEQEIEQIMRAVTYQEPEGNTEDTITLYPLGFDGLPPVKMYIQLLMRVPAGKITRWEDMNEFLGTLYGRKFSELPNAHFPYADYDGNSIPYWRVVSKYGVLNDDLRCSKDTQKRELEEEGLIIVQRGSIEGSFKVDKYKSFLFDYSTLSTRPQKETR